MAAPRELLLLSPPTESKGCPRVSPSSCCCCTARKTLAASAARRANSALLSATPRDPPRRTYPSFGCTQGTTSQISKVPVVSAKSRRWWACGTRPLQPVCHQGLLNSDSSIDWFHRSDLLGGMSALPCLLVSYRPLAQFSSFSSASKRRPSPWTRGRWRATSAAPCRHFTQSRSPRSTSARTTAYCAARSDSVSPPTS